MQVIAAAHHADYLANCQKDTRLVVIKGGHQEPFELMLEYALRPHKMGHSSFKYDMATSTLKGGEPMQMMFAYGQIDEKEINRIKYLGNRFYDDLYESGLIPANTDPAVAWQLALVEAAERQLYGLRLLDSEVKRFCCRMFCLTSSDPEKQWMPTGDAQIYIVDSFLNMSVALLEYLGDFKNQRVVAPSNPTSEQQTSKKTTCRKQQKTKKADRELKPLEVADYAAAKKDPRYSQAENKDAFITRYMIENLWSLTAPELFIRVNEHRAANGQPELETLTIDNNSSDLYSGWAQHRVGSGRKSAKGGSSNLQREQQLGEICQEGLSVKQSEGGFLRLAKTEDERAADILEAEADAIIEANKLEN